MKLIAIIGLLLAAAANAAEMVSKRHPPAKGRVIAYAAKHCHKPMGGCSAVSNSCCYNTVGMKLLSARAVKTYKNLHIALEEGTCDGHIKGRRKGDGCVNSHFGKSSSIGMLRRHPPPRAVDVGDEATDCANPTLVSFAIIDGHSFNVNYHVPEDDSRKLWTLAEAQANYTDVPAELRKWEFEWDGPELTN